MPTPGIDIPFTFPTEWAEWIETLNLWLEQTQEPVPVSSLGMNNLDAFIEYALEQGIAIVRDDNGNIVQFIQMTVTDPANSSEAISIPISDIAESVETAGMIASYTMAGGATGFIDRVTTVGIVLSLMASTVRGLEVAQAIRENLINAVTPYTKDGEHVLVYYGKHQGKWRTYLPEDVIEAVREEAVDLGVFDIEPEPAPSVTVTEMQREYYNNGGTIDSSSENITPTQYADAIYENNKTCFRKTLFTPSHDKFEVMVYQTGYNGSPVYTYSDMTYLLQMHRESSDASSAIYVQAFAVIDDTIHPQTGYFQFYDASNNRLVGGGGGGATDFFCRVGESYKHAVGQSFNITGLRYDNDQWFSEMGIDKTTLPISSVYDTWSLVLSYLKGSTGEGVQGIVATSSLPADAAKTLADLLPDAWNNKVSLAAPTSSDIFNKKNYLPSTIETDKPFEDGTTNTSSEAQEGDIEDPLKTPLVDWVGELIEQLLNDPDNPVPPTYPAGDNGDTPPANPTLLSGSANGLWKIYNPLLADIQAFGSWLWSSSIIDQITRMFASPIDAVIALHQIYCTPVRGSAANIMCGYLDSGVQSTYTVADQYQTIDCGDVYIGEYYHTAVDYTKTKINIYLPFIGIVPLSPSVVMGSTLNVTYRIDVLTGTCLAQIKVIKANSEAVMYSFPGNCACQIPLTGTTYTGMISTLIGLGNTAISVAMDNPFGVVTGAKQALQGAVESVGTGGVRQSGYFGSNAGALGIRIPYVIITHPASYDAMLYNKQYGFPSNKTVTLGSLNGYTKVKDIHLSGIPCTDDELEEIERLLKEGVIIN